MGGKLNRTASNYYSSVRVQQVSNGYLVFPDYTVGDCVTTAKIAKSLDEVKELLRELLEE